MQSRKNSIAETLTNIFVGYSINLVANLIILPIFFGIHISMQKNLELVLLYTLISVARMYFIRRFFTKRTEKKYRQRGIAHV